MRYRQLTPEGDYAVGSGMHVLVDSPEAVAQAVLTRLRLYSGEWFLDSSEGLDKSRILGVRTQSTRDQEYQQRILGTPGVKRILRYGSRVDPVLRSFTLTALIDTIYGQAPISTRETF